MTELKRARIIQNTKQSFCDNFARKYREKILEYSTGVKKTERFDIHKIVVLLEKEKTVEFNYYDSINHGFQMILEPKYRTTSCEELTLIIELLKIWEQD